MATAECARPERAPSRGNKTESSTMLAKEMSLKKNQEALGEADSVSAMLSLSSSSVTSSVSTTSSSGYQTISVESSFKKRSRLLASSVSDSTSPNRSSNVPERPRARRWKKRWVTVQTIDGEARLLKWESDQPASAVKLASSCIKVAAGLRTPNQPAQTEGAITCLQCGRKFHEQSSLRKHMVAHAVRVQCEVAGCGSQFLNDDKLKKHQIERRHGRYFDEFGKTAKVCPVPTCRRTFVDGTSLKRHQSAMRHYV